MGSRMSSDKVKNVTTYPGVLCSKKADERSSSLTILEGGKDFAERCTLWKDVPKKLC